MKPTPEQFAALNPRDAVVLDLNEDGGQQSALVTGISPAKVRFGWKTGPGRFDAKQLWIDRTKLSRFVIAIFPPGAKFLVVDREQTGAQGMEDACGING